ncbi:MAG: BrnT family toxin [Gammaproteobacteria bacterium]|nr:BrnT family toxin [Gammaproteobacteria bacterium]
MALEAGIPVFDDNYRLEYQDTRENYGEDRFITIGRNEYTDILYVCYTMRGHDKTRLISVRMAERLEMRIYERNLRW